MKSPRESSYLKLETAGSVKENLLLEFESFVKTICWKDEGH